MKKTAILLGILLIFTACGSGTDPQDQEVVLEDSYYTDVYSWNDSKGLDSTLLGRSLNLGNYLEAPRIPSEGAPADPSGEGNWTGDRLLTQADLQRIADAGFATVRIPVRWSDYMSDTAPYTILDTGTAEDPFNILDRVKEIIGWAQDANLKVVMNLHHYNEMFDEPESRQAYHMERLDSLWNQLSQAFPLSEYPQNQLVFELMNEPHGTIGFDDWNTIIASLCDIIWVDNAASQVNGTSRRMIMLGTANWGGVPGLYELNLPDACNASNTIVTVHYYEPFHFTHQGASWVDNSEGWIGTRWLGTSSEQAPLLSLFSDIETWKSNTNQNYEIFVGEYGVFSEFSNPSDQKAWTAFIARESEKRNYSWGYWEYASGFGAYDPAAEAWRPQLISALIPTDL